MSFVPGARLEFARRSGKTTRLAAALAEAVQTHERVNVIAPLLEQAKRVVTMSGLKGKYANTHLFVCENGHEIFLQRRSGNDLTFVDEFAFVDELPARADWIGVTTKCA